MATFRAKEVRVLVQGIPPNQEDFPKRKAQQVRLGEVHQFEGREG